jgi:hypothetical protein
MQPRPSSHQRASEARRASSNRCAETANGAPIVAAVPGIVTDPAVPGRLDSGNS